MALVLFVDINFYNSFFITAMRNGSKCTLHLINRILAHANLYPSQKAIPLAQKVSGFMYFILSFSAFQKNAYHSCQRHAKDHRQENVSTQNEKKNINEKDRIKFQNYNS